MGRVLVDDEAQVSLSGDQDAVGGLASAGSDPALGDRAHPGYARKDGHHAGTEGGEDRVEGLGEVAGRKLEQGCDHGAVPAGEDGLGTAALQDGQLVPEHQYLDVLGRGGADQQT